MGKWQVSSLITRCTQNWRGSEVGNETGLSPKCFSAQNYLLPLIGDLWRSCCGARWGFRLYHSFFPTSLSKALSALDEPCFDTQGISPDTVPLETGTTCLLERKEFGHCVWFSCLALGIAHSQLQLRDVIIIKTANTSAAFTLGQVLSLALADVTTLILPLSHYCSGKQDHWPLF